jgi:hypothetical protein
MLFQQGERERIAKERAVMDVQGFEELLRFRAVYSQTFAIGIHGLDSGFRQPSADRLQKKRLIVGSNAQPVYSVHGLDDDIRL